METPNRLNDGTLLYLYGLVPAAAELKGVAGVDNASNVFFVRHEEVACAVSFVPSQEYQDSDGRNPTEQLEWVMPRAWRHHEVLSHLHTAGAVVPLKFGTVCPTEHDVRAMLSRLRASILDLLVRFGGKDEWTLTVSVDRDALTSVLQSEDPRLSALCREAESLAGGRAYMLRRKLEQATAAVAAEKLAALEEVLFRRLFTAGLVSASIEPTPKQPPTGTQLFINAALLLERHRFTDLEANLATFEEEHDTLRLRAHLTGPWPPYSFATTFGSMTGAQSN